MNRSCALIQQCTARVLLAAALGIGFIGAPYAENIDGTWRLVMRKLPDGTVQTPPTVQGYSNTVDGVNQILVFWPGPNGKPASISSVIRFEMSETEITGTTVISVFDDGSGKPPLYNTVPATKTVPVERNGGRVSYQHPFHQPFVVREGDQLTATVDGEFVDYWERVK